MFIFTSVKNFFLSAFSFLFGLQQNIITMSKQILKSLILTVPSVGSNSKNIKLFSWLNSNENTLKLSIHPSSTNGSSQVNQTNVFNTFKLPTKL